MKQMTQSDHVTKTNVVFPEVHKRAEPVDRKAALLRTMVITGILSPIMLFVTIKTLPLTILSMSGLMVYASVVALAIFLFFLLVRYISLLFFAFLFTAKYSVKAKSDFTPFVSIIVPVYNEAKVLHSSVASLLELEYDNYEIIIVNDGSTDDTAAVGETVVGYHRGQHANIKVSLINKPNGGKWSALNTGILYAESEYVLCMDGDSQLDRGTLKAAMRHFVEPSVGAVAGNVKVLNRNKVLTTLQALEYVEGLNMARSAQSLLGMINIIPGPIGVFRKEAIRTAGWYSGETFAEDADLTLNVRIAGWEVRYEPKAISYTEAPETLNQLLKQRYRWTRGILQSIRKHWEYVLNPTINFSNTMVLWSLFYEAIIWPTMNIFANLFFIIVALVYGMSTTIALWWAAIALLDVMTALFCVAVEREEFKLVPYALLYRMVFLLLIDITKAAATIEEYFGVAMTWGKLERVGAANT